MTAYRRALPDDFAGIVALQNRNLSWNLAAHERAAGFLSTAFSLEQFRRMDEEVAVVVAIDDGRVCGYACASTPAFNMSMPFPAAMLSYASDVVYRGRPLTQHRFCVGNPICIDKEHRGSRVYFGLCCSMVELLSPNYELAVGFVATENARHLRLIDKLAWERLGEFEKDGHRFVLIALPLRKHEPAPASLLPQARA